MVADGSFFRGNIPGTSKTDGAMKKTANTTSENAARNNFLLNNTTLEMILSQDIETILFVLVPTSYTINNCIVGGYWS